MRWTLPESGQVDNFDEAIRLASLDYGLTTGGNPLKVNIP